jgi:hypothetical protein
VGVTLCMEADAHKKTSYYCPAHKVRGGADDTNALPKNLIAERDGLCPMYRATEEVETGTGTGHYHDCPHKALRPVLGGE